MRLPLIATSVAAIVAIPMAIAVAAPQMSRTEFLSAVRCTAYEDVATSNANLSAAKWRLNAEASRQSKETAAQALHEVSAIARQAAASSNAALQQERASACGSRTADEDTPARAV
jgi:hypothetical protein